MCRPIMGIIFIDLKINRSCRTSPKSALWWSVIEAVSEDSGTDDEEQKPLDSIKSFHLSQGAVSF
jgi:hypothetical protein